ncbi:MAG: signal recognition particle-docking protein FtsY [Actinomycetota bacterium]
MSLLVILLIIAAFAVVGAVTAVALVVPRWRRGASRLDAPRPGVDYRPGVGDDAEIPRDTPTRSVGTVVELPDELSLPALETPAPAAGRMQRLRGRLARSQSSLGRGLLSVLSREQLDEDAWDEVEEALLSADVGVGATNEIVGQLRTRTKVLGTRSQGELRALLADELIAALQPDMDRTLHTLPHDGRPAVVMVVGVNGTGKTTTCGKLARVLVADGRTVLLGAADTFRAAAADQLQTWGSRVGADTVRGPEGGDPASVAFEAVRQGTERDVDTVLLDTAGRLHTKVGLMDELGKVKRVVEKYGPVDETLLVLDATTGQNGMMQARVFTDVVDVTGIVLTKLDGTAKGGIVISVQRELGLPVKLVGLGEGADDLAPFEPEQFVDALLGEQPE